MTDLTVLNDDTLDAVLNDPTPALILFTTGEGLRREFEIAFEKTAAEDTGIVFAKVDPGASPKAAERFEIGSKPVLIGYACGETHLRQTRPWGSDVPLAVDMLRQYIPATPEVVDVVEVSDVPEEATAVTNKPVAVTDETFQTEVIESDLPVLVDFWAAWCGPCQMVAPILDKLAEEYAGRVKIAKVDVDANPGLSQTFQIRSIPNLMLIKNRTIVFNQPGALMEPQLREILDKLIEIEVPDPETHDHEHAQDEAEEVTE